MKNGRGVDARAPQQSFILDVFAGRQKPQAAERNHGR
jgi:hypothetical protein